MESKTFKFVTASWLLMNYQWIFGSLQSTSMTEYATSIGIILAVWVGREWKEKHYQKNE